MGYIDAEKTCNEFLKYSDKLEPCEICLIIRNMEDDCEINKIIDAFERNLDGAKRKANLGVLGATIECEIYTKAIELLKRGA